MTAIEETVATFRSWLHMNDADSLLATLAAVAANRLEGDPVWLLLVGPPGGGKSEILNALSGLEYVRTAGTLTEASLLSGTPKKESGNAKGGLLREIGDFGIIVAKDFGSILSMNRDARPPLLAALREIYDGSWTRLVGSDGGRSLDWKGKVGFVGGVTPTIDRHHAVMGAMGERFLFYRLPEVNADTQARRALSHAGQEKKMRSELAAATAALLDSQERHIRPLEPYETDRLIALGTFVVRARSAVERDSYTRDIELVPDPEAPTRLPIALSLLLTGLHAIGVTPEAAWRVLTKVALDCIPSLRLSVIRALQDAGDETSTTDLGTAVRHPAITTRRALEDLTAHELVDCHPQGEGKAHNWSLTPFTKQRLEAIDAFGDTAPEMSDVEETSQKTETGMSGTTSLNLTPKKKPDIPEALAHSTNGKSHDRLPFSPIDPNDPGPDEPDFQTHLEPITVAADPDDIPF